MFRAGLVPCLVFCYDFRFPVFMDIFLTRFHTNDDIILVGDINVDCLSTNECGVRDYLDLLAGFALINHIEQVTRERC